MRIDEYAEKLASDLYISYSSSAGIGLRVEAEPLELSIEQAIPCGLILSELVSNALKYAFPGNREGRIVVGIVRPKPGHIKVTVQDNGAGMPEELDWRNSNSLGLKIVQILARQLGGAIELSRAGGTEFQFSFPFEDLTPQPDSGTLVAQHAIH